MLRIKKKFLLFFVLFMSGCGDEDRHIQYPEQDDPASETNTDKPTTQPTPSPTIPNPVVSSVPTSVPKQDSETQPAPAAPPTSQAAPAPLPNTNTMKPGASEVKDISYYYKRAPTHWDLRGTDEDNNKWNVSVKSVSKTAIRINIEKASFVVEREMRLWYEEPNSTHSPNGIYFSITERRGFLSNAELTVSFRRDGVTGDCQVDYLYDGVFDRVGFVAYGKCY